MGLSDDKERALFSGDVTIHGDTDTGQAFQAILETMEVDWEEHLSTLVRLLETYYREPETVNPPRLLTGDDLMRELEISAGPQVGELLEAVREAQAVGEVLSREDALALTRRMLQSAGH